MTRTELMKELNELLRTEYNWSRLSSIDLHRLVESIKLVRYTSVIKT